MLWWKQKLNRNILIVCWCGRVENQPFLFEMCSFLSVHCCCSHSNVSISVQECNLCARIVTLSCYRLPFHILFHKRVGKVSWVQRTWAQFYALNENTIVKCVLFRCVEINNERVRECASMFSGREHKMLYWTRLCNGIARSMIIFRHIVQCRVEVSVSQSALFYIIFVCMRLGDTHSHTQKEKSR